MKTSPVTTIMNCINFNQEKKADKTKRETAYKASFKKLLEEAPKRNYPDPPSTWLQSISTPSSKIDSTKFDEIIPTITTALSTLPDVTELTQPFGNLAIATIASGKKGKVKFFHNINSVGSKTLALEGWNYESTTIEIDPDKLLQTKNTKAPDMKSMADTERKPTDKYKPQLINTFRTPNSIFLPPSFAEYAIEQEENQSITNLYQSAVCFFALKDDQEGLRTYTPNENDAEDPIIDSSEEEDEKTSMMRSVSNINEKSHLFKQEHLIRTLYKWAHLEKSIPACYKKSDDDISKKWGETKLQTLVLKVSAKPKVSFARKDDITQEQKTKRGERLGSPTKKHPHINLTGGDENKTHDMERDIPPGKVDLLQDFNLSKRNPPLPPKDLPKSKPHEKDPFHHVQQETVRTKTNKSEVITPDARNGINSNNKPTDIQNQNEFNKALLKTVRSLQDKIEELTSIPTKNVTSNTDNGALNTLMATLIDQASNSGKIQERFVIAQESLVKMKEQSKKDKISTPIENFVKNVFTDDGSTQLEELPPQIKEIMSQSQETAALTLDLCLHKQRTPAKPMIGFIKALHKGHYSYETGQPGGLNIMSIPHTLNGSGQENFNTNQLTKTTYHQMKRRYSTHL